MEPLQQQMTKRRPLAEINVVPYIDVMLVLLIIFMVTAPMLVQSVPVNLPDVDSTPTEIDPDDTTLMISVSADGLYYVERGEEEPEPMSLSGVTEYAGKLLKAQPDTRYMIRGDESVPYGKVVLLMGNLQGAGITNVGLVTETPDPEARP